MHLHAEQARILATVRELAGVLDRVDLDAARALSGVTVTLRASAPPAAPARLIAELARSWRAMVISRLGGANVERLRGILETPFVDFLGILGRRYDENTHSDVLAWMLRPSDAPTLAPALLRGLAARMPTAVAAAVTRSLDAGTISVRREVVLGVDAGTDAKRRIDLLISGPSFLLAIENKVYSVEHDDQTAAYWAWLDSQRRQDTAGVDRVPIGAFLLSPTGLRAACGEFAALSYLDVLAMALGADEAALTPLEQQVLGSYVHTLAASVLETELRFLTERQPR